ncbi:MAG: XRE family transcriptional regulator [Chloroflexi bacterium]|nr:XRE family transcriptional regulator [Chloroflexota bacterium]
MMPIAHIDFETRSAADLRKVGAHKYAMHKTTDVLCMAYAFDDEPVQLWKQGEELPVDLMQHVEAGGSVVAHNSSFELAIWNALIVDLGGPELTPEQCRCTMAMALAMGLPASLDAAAKAVQLPISKDKTGAKIMLKLCKPRRIEKSGDIVWWDDPTDYETLYKYCVQDVEVERQLEARLVPLSEREQHVWVLDQHINSRGVFVDLPVIRNGILFAEKARDDLKDEIKRATMGALASVAQVAKITAWCGDNGYPIDNLAAATIREALEGDDVPATVRRVLEIRQSYAKASTSKMNAMAAGACNDSRVRGTLQYHGAHTGRWAGRRIQPQNFPRPVMKETEINVALDRLEEADWDALRAIGEPLNVLSDCLRGMIRAAPGNRLIACDFSSIEARALAWLAHEPEPLDVFERGGDIYLHAASGIFNRKITKEDKDERQTGKVATLALGYAGGVGAFQQMATAYRVEVDDKRADRIKKAWRATHPNIVQYWHDIDAAAVKAMLNRGTVIPVGKHIAFRRSGTFLQCRLPSGRKITYPYPEVETCGYYKRLEDDKVVSVRQHKLNTDPIYLAKKEAGETWERDTLFYSAASGIHFLQHPTYGGKLVENIVQGVARDLMVWAMFRIEQAGYPIVMTVHDEIVVEVPKTFGSKDEVECLMKRVPGWARGCPIDVDAWEGSRFRK